MEFAKVAVNQAYEKLILVNVAMARLLRIKAPSYKLIEICFVLKMESEIRTPAVLKP